MDIPLPGVAPSFAPLLIAAAAFVLSHFALSFGPVRRRLVGLIGEQIFLIAYSLIAFATFAWMCLAYTRAPFEDLWGDPLWARWLAVAVMPVAAVFLIAGFSTANPGAIGLSTQATAPAPIGIQKITRHPVLIAIALWAALHLTANGDMASLILFGALLILTLGGILHIEARRRQTGGAAWTSFAAASSVIPFAAILQGRARVSLTEIGWKRIATGIILYVLLLFTHRFFIDAPLLVNLLGK
jgi:uncharacterized membrane protein